MIPILYKIIIVDKPGEESEARVYECHVAIPITLRLWLDGREAYMV
jgi:hypothetical protein